MRRVSSPVAGMKAPYVSSGAPAEMESAAVARGTISLFNRRRDLAKGVVRFPRETSLPASLLRPPTLHCQQRAMAAEAGRRLRRVPQVLLPAPDAATRR